MHVHNGVGRREFLAGGLVSLAAVTLAGCSASGGTSSSTKLPSKLTEPTKKVTINYAGAAYSAADIKPVIAAFEKAHPNIKVNYLADPFENFNSILGAQLSGKDKSIDVFDVDMPRTDAYQNRGWLTDITALFPDIKSQVDPGSLAATTVDGKLVALPYQTSTNFMYYNKKLLKAAGVAFPSADPSQRLTWEQIASDAAKVKAAGAKDAIVFDQIDRYYQLQPLSNSAGGGPGADGKDNLTPDFTNAGWVKAMTWYGDLFKNGLSPRGVTVSETPNLFAAGSVGYFPGGPWWAPQFEANKDLDFGIAPFPKFAGGTAATPTGGWSLGLSPTSQNKDAALIFMKFMAIDNGGYSQYLTALAVPPSNLKGSATFYNGAAFKDPRLAGAVDLMKYELANTAIIRLKSVGFVEFENLITKAYDDIINGADVKTTLSSTSAQLKSAWAQYKR
ncbi:ABC transporter substrate-binding protein [Frondihabitans australicus]|uniref:Carbohydrate ABC transporter substrate-binding protein (CUT1 family) n=1 Tax=Frondihabitans australicus TaxID=386892 RepID=A0A495IJA7_9MICO|nr:sugar ABC transporter substrate-binding protein [Frondihabitans australicus]RKR75869.1 carbohydrate ABC transporter substrate-binding protein (CUT1 family) [Frondihabitans australicus]